MCQPVSPSRHLVRFGQLLHYADKPIVNIMKMNSERANLQLELVRYGIQNNQFGVPRANRNADIKTIRWKWIGHVNRMSPIYIPRVAMCWTPAGNRRRERPKETLRRSVERDMKALGWSWGHVAKLAADRPRWLSSGVCLMCDASAHDED